MIGARPAKAKNVANSTGPRRGRRGRAGLLLVVVLLALGAGATAFFAGGGGGGRGGPGPARPEEPARAVTASPEGLPPAARDPRVRSAEPAAVPGPPADLAPLPGDDGPRFRGARGTIRGSLVVVGGELRGPWELVLTPSTTLIGREHAETRALELAADVREFRLEDLPLAGYDLAARAEGFNGYPQPIQLEARQPQVFVTLQLEPAGFLEGQVVDTAGLPQPGVLLTLLDVDGEAPREATTDAAGRYRFEGVLDGAYELVVGRPESPILPGRRPLSFRAPSLTVPEIELPALATFEVTVADPDGYPLAGVSVRGSGSAGGSFEGETGPDGRFTARYLPAGRFRINYRLEGFEDWRAPYELERGAVKQAYVVLHR